MLLCSHCQYSYTFSNARLQTAVYLWYLADDLYLIACH